MYAELFARKPPATSTYSAICVEHLGVIAAETLTHRDGPGGELVAQS